MGSEALLRRLGFGGSGVDTALVWRLIAAILLLYALGFALWYPSVVTNTDESNYLLQTRLLLEGRTAVEKVDPFTGEIFEFLERPYPNGLPLLMAPFVWAGGVGAAYWVPLLSVVAAVLMLGRWLQEQGHSPLFALLALGFAPTLVMGRVAMSDTPSLALVALGTWLFWRGLDRGWPWWLASGFVVGSSMTVRFTNCLPFVGLYAGTVLRRERACLALIAGGLAGLGVRALVSYLQFGDPFFERGRYFFDLAGLSDRLALYLFALVVLVPGGLLAAFAYRGRRRPELLSTVLYYLVFYLFQEFSTDTTGPAKRVVLALRYFMELLPLLVLAMAEVAPRAWQAFRARLSGRGRARATRLAALALGAWLAGLAGAALAVHAYLGRWSQTQAAIVAAIHQHTGDESVLVTNPEATSKFLRQIERRYVYTSASVVGTDGVAELLRRHGEVFVVMLDRTDSEYWRLRTQENEAFIAALAPPTPPELDRQFSPTDRLRIWRLRDSGG